MLESMAKGIIAILFPSTYQLKEEESKENSL